MSPPEHHHQQPNHWLIKLLSLQAPPIISNTILSLTSNFLPDNSTKQNLNSDTPASPPTAVGNGGMFLKKVALGVVGAIYMFLVLMTVMAVAGVIGVGFVRLWVEEPLCVEEKLYFDYTNVNPYAVLDLGFLENIDGKLPRYNVPVGHVCNVRVVFVMPESEYNREIGMFQVVAESLSSSMDTIGISSHPCMLQFRSPPIRAMQTLLKSAPLVLGITNEIQKMDIPLLRYKEHHYPRTQSIRITLIPRAGTPYIPQLYEAKVIVRSELPWRKALVRNWKWTFYVWTSLYVYLMLLLLLLSCFRSIMFPAMITTMATGSGHQQLAVSDDSEEEPPRAGGGGARERPTSESLQRWRESRSKRKARVLGNVGSDATSMSVTRGYDTTLYTEEVGDSESVCQ